MSSTALEKPEAKKAPEQRKLYRPSVALYENSEAYIVLVELPGADEKAIQLRLEKGLLTIEAPLKLDLPAAGLKYSELRLGDYRRVLDLGDLIDEDKIEAACHAGLLKLSLPKIKSAKPRKIAIQTT